MTESPSSFSNPASGLFPGDDEWIRLEADDIAMSFPDRDLLFLAEQLERCPLAYDQGPAACRAVAAELRQRHMASIRFWPGVSPPSATSAGLELIDDEIPW